MKYSKAKFCNTINNKNKKMIFNTLHLKNYQKI